jgi:Cu2+-exporting ATPase
MPHETPGALAGHDEHGAHAGHDKHAGHDPEMFRRRFWVSLVLTVPLVVTSHMVMDWFGYTLDFPGIEWVGPLLGSVVFLWGGWPFLEGGVREVRDRQPGMMLLISMAITVAYTASMATSLGWFDLDFWWELAALVTIMLLGHWQEMKAIGQARGALAALAELIPDDAERVRDDGTLETVGLTDLAVGDVVLVRAGGRVPADGEIVDGEAELDESMITGESRPVAKAGGDRVVAGTVSTDSSIRVRVTAVGEDTALAGIQRMVADAQASSSRAQVLADRFAALLFYVATGAAVATFVVWSALGDVDSAVTKTVTVLVIACPHALGLAIPLVIAISTAVSARAGILVKDRLALERMRTIDAVLFDKTGTLTKGAHVVTGVVAAEGTDEDRMVAIAGAVESDSEHPLARAITAEAAHRGDLAVATDFRARTGRGVDAVVDGERYSVGGPALQRESNASVPDAVRQRADEWAGRGAAVLYLFRGDQVIGAFALEDEVRSEAREAVDELKDMGIQVVMITGDAHQVADAVGAELGLDRVMAEVLPEDKDRAVAELQEQGLRVAMVGDGVNDAPALARADVGLAIGAGTDVAIESAGVVLASSDPRAVTGVVRLSRASYTKMLQNLAWAAGYNIVAIPLAAGAFAWAGIDLSPAVGAILMSMSTIVVALNAQLLRRVQLRPSEPGSASGG